MPEDVKLSPYVPAKDYKSDYCSPVDDSHPESSIYADHSDREMSRSETSSCSDESGYYKQNGHETIEIIPTRTIKTSVPKPATNPLQFVKIGPCDLYRSAQKQIRKVSEVKTPKKEVKDEVAMDWQSNLDSWKCNRRKQQEHIIERVVEVKKLELEEHDRNRKRTKTFSEMMEERTSKGRKASLPVYLEDDNDDLSDLGLNSNKNGNEPFSIPEENDDEENEEKPRVSKNYDEADEPDRSSNKNHRLLNVKKSTNTTGLRKYCRRASATKIEEKLSELERIKNRSVSSTDLTESNKKSISVPKVNIFQRKEIFEKYADANETNKIRRLNEEIPPVRSIKERLSSLSRTIDETTTTTTATKTTDIATTKPKTVLPVSEVSVKERLSSINKKISEHNARPRVPEKSENCLKKSETESCGKTKEDASFETRPLCKPIEELSRREYNSSGRSSSSEDYDHVHQTHHFHHRSLDSLQGHDSPNGFCFERVQSLECINCCSNYPASVLSGDTDREDSGIHTADVSSSVSQADDFDLHADTSMDVDVKSQNAMTLINDNMKVDKSSQNECCFVSQETQQGSLDDIHEHVDAIVVKCENRISSFNQVEGNATNVTPEEKLSTIEMNQKLDDIVVTEPREVLDENQNSNEQLSEEDTARLESKNTCQNDDALCDSNVASRVDEDCWRVDCGVVDRNENVDKPVEEILIEEKISPVLHVKCLDVLEKHDQNIVNGGKEGFSTMESSSNLPSSPDFDYNYETNNESLLEEDSPFNFTESRQLFAFEPPLAVAEPPKEKPPPPPPTYGSDEESDKAENLNGLRRMDSTKRIKKQLRLKRSSFLGIEGFDDDSYLEPELDAVKPPPDMTTFLQEERRLEQLLFRQSICSESDSTLGESRDSGVELDKNHNEESSWLPERANNRPDMEIYANTSVTSEEDETMKKEREILEILEMEERRIYETEANNECNYIGEKLVLKLKELENQEIDMYWNEEKVRSCHDDQKGSVPVPDFRNYNEPVLEQRFHQSPESTGQPVDLILLQQQWVGRSLQDLSEKETTTSSVDENLVKTRLDYRNSMPNIQQESPNGTNNQQPKQPAPVRDDRLTYFKEALAANKSTSPHQMSKQTLQALSAVPRSKITDSWVQTKKKPRQETYNYQHWLIQEAEHRRITEYHQRKSKENAHNYVNIQPEFLEPAGILTDAAQHQQQASSSNRVVTYSHPSHMLPYRNQSQSFSNNNESKSQTKMQCSNSSNSNICNNNISNSKPLPDSVIQTLTQRVQNRLGISDVNKQRRQRESYSNTMKQHEKMLSVSGKKKCSHCGEELGRGAAMIIESLRLFYHIDCFRCCVCCVQLGDGLMGTDVRVRNSKLHCHSCYSNDEGLKFSCV